MHLYKSNIKKNSTFIMAISVLFAIQNFLRWDKTLSSSMYLAIYIV